MIKERSSVGLIVYGVLLYLPFAANVEKRFKTEEESDL